LASRQFQTTGLGPQHPNRQPYELARLATLFTLGTWLVTVVWLLAWWFSIGLVFSFSIGLVLASIGSVLHVPVFLPNIIGLMTMHDRVAHWPLTALCLLNLLNTVLMFTVMIALLSTAP
jgi:hypothetical protein